MMLVPIRDLMGSKFLRFCLTFSVGSISDSPLWETGSIYTSVMAWKVTKILLHTNAENMYGVLSKLVSCSVTLLYIGEFSDVNWITLHGLLTNCSYDRKKTAV